MIKGVAGGSAGGYWKDGLEIVKKTSNLGVIATQLSYWVKTAPKYLQGNQFVTLTTGGSQPNILSSYLIVHNWIHGLAHASQMRIKWRWMVEGRQSSMSDVSGWWSPRVWREACSVSLERTSGTGQGWSSIECLWNVWDLWAISWAWDLGSACGHRSVHACMCVKQWSCSPGHCP